MNRSAASVPAVPTSRLLRRLVLGTAVFLGLALALMPRSPSVHAQEPKHPPVTAPTAPKSTPKSLSITDGRGAEIKIDVGDGGRTSVTTTEPAAGADTGGRAEDAGDASSRRDGKPRKRARVTIDGIGTDREFDSFDQFVQDEPALAGMVVAVVAVVFLAPVLAIALILWYRMRKARMLNETMLKLAERGIVPSAEAIDALGGGKQPAAMATYYEQAKQVRRKAAWSDLRKGVLMGGFGLALSVYSLLADREPNVPRSSSATIMTSRMRRRRRPALTVLWAAAGLGIALALPGTVVDVARDVLGLIIGQRVSLAGIAAGVAALGVATWAAAAVALRGD